MEYNNKVNYSECTLIISYFYDTKTWKTNHTLFRTGINDRLQDLNISYVSCSMNMLVRMFPAITFGNLDTQNSCSPRFACLDTSRDSIRETIIVS